jgi:hypothetical protein
MVEKINNMECCVIIIVLRAIENQLKNFKSRKLKKNKTNYVCVLCLGKEIIKDIHF